MKRKNKSEFATGKMPIATLNMHDVHIEGEVLNDGPQVAG
jgi:hypothetical protein